MLGSRNGEAPRALGELLKLVENSTKEAPKGDALEDAQKSIQKSFVFKFAEESELVNRAALQEILDYPPDFDQEYLNRINAVTTDQVLSAAGRHVSPSDLTIVVVGGVPPEAFRNIPTLASRDIYRLEFDTLPKVTGKIGD